MSAPITIYADKELTKPIDAIRYDEPVEVGTVKEITIYIHNDSQYTIANLEYSCDNEHVTFKVAPNIINGYDTHDVVIAYTPPLDLRVALEAKVNIDGNEIIPPTSGILAVVGPK